jgi:hypothetical protein
LLLCRSLLCRSLLDGLLLDRLLLRRIELSNHVIQLDRPKAEVCGRGATIPHYHFRAPTVNWTVSTSKTR